ncbi:MAG: hypothetical protein RLZZ618_3974 [Pseudomonadota bacterium]
MQAATVSASAEPTPPSADADAARAKRKTFVRHAVRNVRTIAASYLLDGLVLMLFSFSGQVNWKPVLLYTLIGIGSCELWALAFRREWTFRFKDPHATQAMGFGNMALQVVGIIMMPTMAFMFLLIMFIVFTTNALRSSLRTTAMWGALSCVAIAGAVQINGVPVTIPDMNVYEQLLALVFASLALWQCIWVGTYNGAISALLKKRSGELAELTRKVQELAHHDELTGLLNRRSLLEILTEEQHRTDRTGVPLSVAMIDIDRFKSINDTFGHSAGDLALKALSSTIKQLTRSTDRFGRYGGEEFLMIMTSTNAEEAPVPIERFREALKARGWDDVGPGLDVTFSCGVSTYVQGESIEDLIKRADDALYRAKHDGRNCTRSG